MLRALRIKDLAIIDELNLEFTKGFAVCSGETGAGKSIIVDALDLITGGRGSSDIVRDGCEETVIEGIFESLDKGLNKESHRGYLDEFGKLTELRELVANRYMILNDLQTRLNKLEEDICRKKEKEDLIRFQLSEIKGASLKQGEDIELEGERVILSNSQNLSALSHDAYSILYENDGSVITSLSKAENLLSEIAGIDPGMTDAADMVRTSRVNLKEASDIIRRFIDRIRHDPERLESVNERIYLLDRLKKKYGGTIEDILALQESLEKDLTGIESLDHDVSVLRDEIDKVLKDVRLLADELSESRRKAAGRFEAEVVRELSNLSMAS